MAGLEDLAREMRRINTPKAKVVARGRKDAAALGLTLETADITTVTRYYPVCPRCGGTFTAGETREEAFENLLQHLGWGAERCKEIKAGLDKREASKKPCPACSTPVVTDGGVWEIHQNKAGKECSFSRRLVKEG